jgi:hypothetical protein
MVAAIDLDQLAVALTPKAGLVETSALLAGQPKPVGNHPSTKRLPADLEGMLLPQELGRERWTEVGVLRSHQLDRILPYAGVPLAVRGSASSLVDQRSASAFLVSRQQPKGLTHTQRQHCRRRHHRAPPGQNFCQYLYSLQIPLTHRYQSHSVSVTSNGRNYDLSKVLAHIW